MTNSSFPRLLGDVGGTHARFAWQEHSGAAPSDAAAYLCRDHGSLTMAVRHYIAEYAKDMPRTAAIGMANPVTGDRVQMTNHVWTFSIAEMQTELGLHKLVVLNDFAALALALHVLPAGDLHQIGPGTATPGGNLALLGPGTGLGVSGLIAGTHGQYLPMTGEGGHVTLAAGDDREAAVIQRLRQRFGHVSAERALSGPGLVNLYEAVSHLAAKTSEPLEPAAVIERAREGRDLHCVTALELFFNFLGSVAGDLALTTGARGGVYIGGGITPRLIAELERSSFRDRFESKGRFRDYLRDIPTIVINTSVSPAFLGAARALDMT